MAASSEIIEAKIITIAMGSCANICAKFVPVIGHFLATTWMENFVQITVNAAESSAGTIKESSLDCVNLYSKCKRGLSYYFTKVFILYQIMLVVSTYIAISYILGNDLNYSNILFIVANILHSIALIGWLLCQSMVAGDCHKALLGLAKSLRKRKMQVLDNVNEAAWIDNIIDDIEAAGPLTGGGFFDVEQKTVTSIIGCTVTYLIVLLQFKSSEPNPSTTESTTFNKNK